jgi:hypothetical protein
VRQVIKERRAKELQFDASICNAPPDFSRLHKTDYLARKLLFPQAAGERCEERSWAGEGDVKSCVVAFGRREKLK